MSDPGVALKVLNAIVQHNSSLHNRLRETSRLTILPLTEEANGSVGGNLDGMMATAGGVLGVLVKAKADIVSPALKDRAEVLSKLILELLPEADTGKRLAANYGLLASLAEVVSGLQYDNLDHWAIGLRGEMYVSVMGMSVCVGVLKRDTTAYSCR